MNIYFQLICSFFKIGCLTVGGGYAMLPLIRDEIARHAWLSPEQFLDILAIAEMTPGPLAVNAATFIGYRTAGITGALAANSALAAPSLAGMILMAIFWHRHKEHKLTRAVMDVLRPVVAGLIAGAAIHLTGAMWQAAPADVNRAVPLALAAGAFAFTRFSKINPALVMALAGLLGAWL